ncbi:MAG: UDP-glucose-hexose-1-phosphateuridylyltransfera se [Candidatus Falkowbacteria bacterium GW2011_GWA2_41_14]|uniref:UDP-glucose-hexose-1-phosphateuridylyltransfera se n=1 Tax=Candidatus Falkowbacteria bacterium GW2011_GWA2_41_14 TaxID=1618635 RepID=A0A0G0UUP1_9BACT|nr:MAG: UDP-glucose-hexose-1-phosphateuridylyltransfera se [Candidatus Falkowbacteria bacterium GW2011_GWA2_41_14]
MLKSEIRKDYLLDKYVIITPGRALRPRDVEEQTIISRVADCPFCPEKINQKNIVDQIDAPEGKITSVKNIFPAVTLDNNQAYGAQEVIVETPDHQKELHDLSAEQIENLLRMYAKRTDGLSKVKNIEYILCFKNQGSKAGASIIHAHSQIFATDIIPPDIREELKVSYDYQLANKTCAYCDIIKKEMASPRAIYEDKFIACFAPYASQYHYESWIFTKRHLDNITKFNNDEFAACAKILKKILLKLSQLNLSFNYFLHQVISDSNQHFYIKIQPRDSVWAGVELGSGLVINSIAPEEAAKFLKN